MHTLLRRGKKYFKLGEHDAICKRMVFDLNIAYNMMSLLIYHLTIHEMVFAPKPAMTLRNAYFEIVDSMLVRLDDVIEDIIQTRLDEISDVEICRVEEILWIKYEDRCMCYDCAKKPNIKNSKNDKRSAAKCIGKKKRHERYRAKVWDRTNDRMICDKSGVANGRNRNHLVEMDLYAHCLTLKTDYEVKLKKEMEYFYKDRVKKIKNEFPNFWGMNPKKYLKM